jgi:hypothetical protein
VCGTEPGKLLVPFAAYFRTTVKLRQPALPAASKARTTMLLVPTRSGIDADQNVVPEAVPVELELVHPTTVTPTLSVAMPITVIEAPGVETMVAEGDLTLTAGAVVSLDGTGVGGGGGSSVRVTTKVEEAVCPVPSLTVTVMWLSPTLKGTEATDQEVDPIAVPTPPRSFCQLT